MEQEGAIPEGLLLQLREISDHAAEIGFLVQDLLSQAPRASMSLEANDATTLLTLLLLSFFLGFFTILGKASGKASLLIVNLAAPVCTAIAAGVWLVIGDSPSAMGQAHRLLLVFLLAFGVSGGLASVYKRFDIELFRKSRPPSASSKKSERR